jgi:hypothetical protein
MDRLVQEHRRASTDDANEQGKDEDRFGLEHGMIPQQAGELGCDETSQIVRGANPEHRQSSPFFSVRVPLGGVLNELQPLRLPVTDIMAGVHPICTADAI